MHPAKIACSVSVYLALALCPAAVCAETGASVATMDDVCAAIDLLNRSVDRVLAARGLPAPPEPVNRERGLRLEHIYQLHMACLAQLHEIESQGQIGRIPPLAASRAMHCRADDVVALSNLMHDELKRPAWILWVVKLPEERAAFSGKTADDAFSEVLRLYAKMNALAGKHGVAAGEVYSQLTRCVADAKAVLQRLDSAHRYRIDAPVTQSPKAVADVYERCIAIRRTLAGIADELNQPDTPVPKTSFAAGENVAGQNVFVQAQIVLAELNRIKVATGTAQSTPLAIAATEKTWTDAYNQAALLDYLLSQFGELRRLSASEAF